jgi:hypothetical protein
VERQDLNAALAPSKYCDAALALALVLFCIYQANFFFKLTNANIRVGQFFSDEVNEKRKKTVCDIFYIPPTVC